MSGLISITIQEARGFVAINSEIDRLGIVIGCASGLPAVPAGLRAAAATVASPVTLLPASLLTAGIAAVLANPRRITFTTGGVTPSDAPASLTITGLIANPNGTTTAGSEVLSLSQVAGIVTSVNPYKVITSLVFLAGDGTGATIAIGYGEGNGQSPFFLSGSSAVAAVGYGDAVDTLTQMIEQRQTNGAGTKYPAALYTARAGTLGSYGTINLGGITVGTALPAVDTETSPFGTYYARVRIIDDGNDGEGAVVGTTGILYQWGLDGPDDGVTYSNTTALGTDFRIDIPNSGTAFLIDPPAAELTQFVASVVEAQTVFLAHLANAVAHDAADTSAEQIALAAAAAPTTPDEALAVLLLILAAHDTHLENYATVHNGPDTQNVVTSATPTTIQEGIRAFREWAVDYGIHRQINEAAATAGLRAATATVASPVTLTSADLLDAGEALIAIYPRRITFTTAGVTPADAPADVDIVGTLDGAPVSETLVLSQIAGVATSVNAYESITSLDFPAADGTAATIAIGYAMGVHNSSDVTNVLTEDLPTHGTLATGDSWKVRTFAPIPSTQEIADAFTAITAGSAEAALVVLEFPLTQAMVTTVTTGLNQLAAVGRDVTCLARVRLPDFEADETELAWLTSVQAAFLNQADSRIHLRADYGMITDAMTSRQYRRALLAQVAADVVRIPRALWPDVPADQAMANVTLIDANGATVGHDEGPQGAATGLSSDTLGNRFGCVQRLADATDRQAVYMTVPWVLYDADERIRTLMVRRLANAMKRVARAAARPFLGAPAAYTATGPTTGVLLPGERKKFHSVIFKAVTDSFASELINGKDAALDTGLVQVNPIATVAPGRLLGLSITLAPRPLGFVQSITITFTVEE
jgi:hypothetical protein